MTKGSGTGALPGGQRKAVACALLALLIAGALTYRGSLENGFHFDDMQHIHQNRAVRIHQLSFAALKQSMTQSPNARRPLPYATFAFDWWRGDGSPRSFQWTNIALHVVTSFAVFGLLVTLLGRMRGRIDRATIAAALGAAALWCLHPIQVQAVTYIVQRMALLAGLFTIVSVLAFVRARLSVAAPERVAWIGLCLVSFLLGSLSKQNAWITPALWVLAELGVVRNGRRLFRSKSERLILTSVAIAGIVVFVGAAVGHGPLAQFTAGYAERDFSLLDRLRTQPRVVLFHVSQILWPIPSRFSLEHDFAVSRSLLDPITTLPAILVVFAWCAGGCWFLSRRGKRVVGFWMLWVPATLVVESTIIPLEMVFEHRMYLPSVGLFGLLSLPLAGAFAGGRGSWAAAGLAAALALALLGSATSRYLSVWRNPVVLAEHTIRKAPLSARAWSNLALAYLERGRRDDAEEALRRSMSFDSNSRHSLELMGLILFDRGRLSDARHFFDRALALGPASPGLLNHLGEVELAEGENAKAASLFQRAAALKPWIPVYHWNRALALEGLDRCAEARSEWRTYLELSSDAGGKEDVENHLREVHSTPEGRCYSQP